MITVDANNRYRFRFINSFCTICPGQLTVEGHNLTVIAMDGQFVEPVTVDSIVSLAGTMSKKMIGIVDYRFVRLISLIFTGERYDFVINTDQIPGAYWIQLRGLDSCASTLQLAVLQYVGESSTPRTNEPTSANLLPAGNVSHTSIKQESSIFSLAIVFARVAFKMFLFNIQDNSKDRLSG